MTPEPDPTAISRASPNFPVSKAQKGDIYDLIEIYLDRIHGWMIEPARHLIAKPFDVIPAFTLCLPYFETHATYARGQSSRRRSKEFFVSTFAEVCSRTERAAGFAPTVSIQDLVSELGDHVYTGARCGLLHVTSVKAGILLGTVATVREARLIPEGEVAMVSFQAAKETGKTLNAWIAVDQVINSIAAHADAFTKSLRAPENSGARRAFLRGWNINNPGLQRRIEIEDSKSAER